MRICEVKDYQEMSRKAANILAAQVILKPDCVLGLATGSTPIGTYDRLVELYESGNLDFSAVRTVNLDEYKGLTREHDQSYYYFMHEHLFDRVNIVRRIRMFRTGRSRTRRRSARDMRRWSRLWAAWTSSFWASAGTGISALNEPSDRFAQVPTAWI